MTTFGRTSEGSIQASGGWPIRPDGLTWSAPARTLENAQPHGIMRWMVYGRADGWWPVYTLAGPVNLLPAPPRVWPST